MYQADWSQGLDEWPNTSGWSTLNGILINDGTGSAARWLPAPYRPSVSDYAVEAEMRIDHGCNSNGVVAHAVGSNNYAAGAWCGGGVAQIWEWSNNAQNYNPLGTKGFAPGNGWHKYRLEVKGNSLRLLIDGVLMLDVIDDAILTPGLVGLWSEQEQLEVRSFTVYSL